MGKEFELNCPAAFICLGSIIATASKNHLDALDWLRGVAILGVACFHTLLPAFGTMQPPWNGNWRFPTLTQGSVPGPFNAFIFGWVGVPIFFALSGFCIHYGTVVAGKFSAPAFFARRFFRIFLPYWIALAFFSFIWPGTGRDWFQFLMHAAMLHNFSPETVWGINGSFWSLATEVQLYVLYPILLAWIGRGGWRSALLVTGILGLALRCLYGLSILADATNPWLRVLTASPIYYWFDWAFGAFAAECFLQRKPLLNGRAALALFVFGILSHFHKFTSAFTSVAFSVGTSLAFPLIIVRPLSPRHPLVLLGLCSYSLYLWHEPFIIGAGSILRGLGWAPMKISVALLGGILLGAIICWQLYRLIKIPSIRLGKALLRKRESANKL
jgi:peptidoglycan/LPS O-acetylase OafA/YrhL